MDLRKMEVFRYFESTNKNFGVKISGQLLRHLHDLCEKSYPYETGGILIGRYSENLKWAKIVAATGAPNDSKRSFCSFIRSSQGVSSLLKRMCKKRQYYLGEWHYHPNASPQPSKLDIETMLKLSKSEELRCPEPILLIVGGNSENWYHYVGVHLKNGQVELNETASA